MPNKKKIEQPFDENPRDEKPTAPVSQLNERHHPAYEVDDASNPLLNGGIQHTPHCPRCAALQRANAVKLGDTNTVRVAADSDAGEKSMNDESRTPYRTPEQQFVKKGQHVFNEDGELVEYERVPRQHDMREPMDPITVAEEEGGARKGDELRASRPWREDEEPLQK